MALTRKFLKSMGLNDEQIDSVIEEHTNTVNALKDEVTRYKEDAEKLPTVQKELDNVKSMTADYDEWKTKYKDEHKAFEDYKADVSAKEMAVNVRNAYKELLKNGNVDEDLFDTILDATNFSGMTLNSDNKFDNEKELAENIATKWKKFIVSTETRGTEKPEKPLESHGSDLSADAKYIRERAAKRHAGTYGEIATKE